MKPKIKGWGSDDAQIKRFIKKVAGKDIRFRWYWSPRHRDYNYGGFANTRGRGYIGLHRKNFARYNDVERRATIFHEIGHFFVYHTSVSKKEYLVQRWAIRRANKLRMHRVARNMINFILSWENFKWDSEHRIYILAARLAKKHRIKRLLKGRK